MLDSKVLCGVGKVEGLVSKSVQQKRHGEGEGQVSVFSAKRWDCRSSFSINQAAILCHDAQVKNKKNCDISLSFDLLRWGKLSTAL